MQKDELSNQQIAVLNKVSVLWVVYIQPSADTPGKIKLLWIASCTYKFSEPTFIYKTPQILFAAVKDDKNNNTVV